MQLKEAGANAGLFFSCSVLHLRHRRGRCRTVSFAGRRIDQRCKRLFPGWLKPGVIMVPEQVRGAQFFHNFFVVSFNMGEKAFGTVFYAEQISISAFAVRIVKRAETKQAVDMRAVVAWVKLTAPVFKIFMAHVRFPSE